VKTLRDRRGAPLLACVLGALAWVAAERGPRGDGFVLAGESVRFDADLRPRFTDQQLRATALATRDGFTQWAATPEGKAIIRRIHETEREVRVFAGQGRIEDQVVALAFRPVAGREQRCEAGLRRAADAGLQMGFEQ
jgi:hypothetical protein